MSKRAGHIGDNIAPPRERKKTAIIVTRGSNVRSAQQQLGHGAAGGRSLPDVQRVGHVARRMVDPLLSVG